MVTQDVFNIIKNNSIQVVAFDIFDTLVARTVPPEYVKKLWSKAMVVRLNLDISFNALYEMRRNAEATICNENHLAGYDLEFSYLDMCKYIYRQLKLDITEQLFCDICVEEELASELKVLYVLPDIVDLLTQLQSENKQIIAISDFYLPKHMMKVIFGELKLDSYFTQLWISCDYLVSKRSGRLYDLVLEDLKLTPEDILMIGDNNVSDVQIPASKGIYSLWLSAEIRHKWYKKRLKELESPKYSESIIKSHYMKNTSHFENIVFSLYSFIETLHEKLLRDGHKNVFFLSREGQFFKKLFDSYQEHRKFSDACKLQTHYLIVSRKSTFLPSLGPIEGEEFNVLFRQYKLISAYEFLSSLNFPEDEIVEIRAQLKIDMTLRESDFPDSLTLKNLKALPFFQSRYEHHRAVQKENFVSYINDSGVDWQKDSLAVVDVGWKGSIQDNICKILNIKTGIDGYYLGLCPLAETSKTNRKLGLLFYNINGAQSSNYQIYNVNRSLFEMILGADHGSASSYESEEGSAYPLTDEQEKEHDFFQNVISPIQENIFNMFLKINSDFSNTTLSPCDYENTVSKIHANMVLFPTRKEMSFFRKMYHYENFGIFEYSTFEKKSLSLSEKLKNLLTFIRHPWVILERGFWIPLTLEDAGLRCMIKPYGFYKIFKYHKLQKNAR